jgi:hypothetical protein
VESESRSATWHIGDPITEDSTKQSIICGTNVLSLTYYNLLDQQIDIFHAKSPLVLLIDLGESVKHQLMIIVYLLLIEVSLGIQLVLRYVNRPSYYNRERTCRRRW